MPEPSLRVIDLFAGAGGLTRGFTDQGDFTPVAAVESDPVAAATYAANFGAEHVHCEPVQHFLDDPARVPKADVVVGGPPCQGFSNLGKRQNDDERNELFVDFLDVAAAADADVFVFENVARFRKQPQCQRLIDQARRLGYDPTVFTLNAADFGTPQSRIRTIVIGSRLGLETSEPHPTHARQLELGKDPWRTVEDAWVGMPTDPVSTKLPSRFIRLLLDAEVEGTFTLDEIHLGRTYQELSLRRYDCIAPGRNRFDLPDELLYDCWRNHRSGSSDVLGRLEWNKPAVTIRTEFFKPEKGRYLHPQWELHGARVNRAITHAEAALLQGFDRRHVWCGRKGEIARQIGNAVPPPLATALARTVSGMFSAARVALPAAA